MKHAPKLKIAILGTRGIPNRYGGFEQLAEFLSVGLQTAGHDITVYCSNKHPYQETNWNGVTLVHCNDPEDRIGTAGQFLYDWNCIKHAKKEHFDVWLFLGYTSSSVWGPFYPKGPTIISNMDGLEWKRSKYSKMVQEFLKFAERWGVKYSDYYIADSPAIQSYLKSKYQIESEYIAYGAKVFDKEDDTVLDEYKLQPGSYYMLMARMEPENNIETILDGYCLHSGNKELIVLGNTNNKFGTYLVKKFAHQKGIRFLGAIYEGEKIHTLKLNSSLYFHGHSVGGTNPSLLEAMASKCLIAAHNNEFNRAILEEDAYYFSSAFEVAEVIKNRKSRIEEQNMIEKNFAKINQSFNWPRIIDQYENLIVKSFIADQS